MFRETSIPCRTRREPQILRESEEDRSDVCHSLIALVQNGSVVRKKCNDEEAPVIRKIIH